MIRKKLSRCFYFFISLTLLLAPIPVSAMVQSLQISDIETEIMIRQSHIPYIYLGKELSKIAQLVSELHTLDYDQNSSLSQLHNHIAQGFSVAHCEDVAAALAHAEIILQKLDHTKSQQFFHDFEDVVDKFMHGLLTINAAGDVDEHIKRSWTNYVRVLGLLSVNDQIVQNITAVDLSVTDTNIQNATIATLSVTDEIAQNLSLINLSVVEETVTGTLSANDAVIDTYLRFTDTAGGEYVGIQAPGTVPTSYTLSLPTTSPAANQLLRANATTPTNLEWATDNSFVVPANSKTIYVTKYGNDITGDGSFATPYASLSKAITTANSIASSVNPIAIIIAAGIYVENNSAGALSVTAEGISIVGISPSSVIIMPSTPANDLLTVGSTIRIANITFQSSSPLATGISLTAGNLTVLNNVRVFNFLTGVSCSGGATESYGFTTCFFVDNSTALAVSSTRVESNNSSIFGTSSMAGPAANTGLSVTGSSSSVVFSGGVIGLCATGIEVTSNAFVTISGVNCRINAFDVIQSGASRLTASGCTFELTDSSSDVDIQVSGAGTIAEIISCEFSGASVGGSTQGTGIVVINSGVANISGGVMHNYTTALQVGDVSDMSSTAVSASGLIIRNCATDILQQGTATLLFDACTASSTAITINDATNVELSFFDLDDNGALTIGSTADQDTSLIQVDIDPANHPGINYLSSLYSTQAVGFNNPFGSASSLYSLSADNTDVTSITTDRTKIAGLRLVSDTGSPVGGTTALRGWDINKNGSTAELSLTYQNSDVVGQSVIAPYIVAQFDGVNNQVQLPTAGTQIVFAADTNLYRSAANVLKTDDNFIVGTLTANRAVVTDGSDQLASSATTATEIGYVSGVTSSIQTQIDGKVAKAGDTMTGTLIMPAGSAAAPSIQFTGSTNTGFSAATANTLSFDTNGAERMKIDGSGNVTIDGFGTAGVVHNDSSGLLSSSLIVNADITNGTIANTKLATISSADIAGNIVVRDGSGNFATNMITIDGTVTNNTDVATKEYVDSAVSTGLVAKTPAEVVAVTNQTLSGYPTIDGVTFPSGTDRILLTGQTNPVENGLWVASAGAWTRPADFASGTPAGQAYVLILQGTTEAGSAWLCNTPTAIIDTDPLGFALFSLPNTTTGANVGSGTGLIFKNKTGSTLNFRSLLAGTHMSIVSNTDDITIATDATNANTASTIVARDASGNFSAGTITASLTGAASLNVLKAGDTMTGTLTHPAGSAAAPSIQFTGSTNTGLSAATANTLSFDTSGVERMNVNSTGVTINNLSTVGVVHNSAAGLLSTSLIVNADVDPAAAIVDTKLATISTAGKVANSATTATSANTPNTIVLRDGSGNFNAGTISASLTGAASLNVLKAGDTMTGSLQLPAGTTANPSLIFTGSTTTGLSAASGALSLSTSGAERLKIASGGTISVNGFTSAGVVHNDASGNLSSSLIVNADVSATAAIIDTKLATISTAGKVANSATTATSADTANAIVARDASGNFTTNMITIDGTVTNPTDVTTKAYVDAQITATGTNLNTPNTLVRRDNTGSFAAQVISMVDGVHSGNLILSTEPSTSTAGNITKGSSRFIHDFGTNNTFVGINAGNFTTSGSGGNSGFGVSALTANGTGAFNTAVGKSALAANTVGANNTALGYNALLVSTTGADNTAIGYNALAANATGTSNNTAVGSSALAANTTGTLNTAVGKSALAANTVGVNNTALGYNALLVSTTGTDNTAIGYNALAANATGTSNNTAVGSSALAANATGTSNTAVGKSSLAVNVIGTDNTAVGFNALTANVASRNTAVGSSALAANTTGIRNVAVGYDALVLSDAGSDNVAVGVFALESNTTGSNNQAIGTEALGSNTVGHDNQAIGSNALAGNTFGFTNVAIGTSAMADNTVGQENVAVGGFALGNNVDGNFNVAVGRSVMVSNVSGSSNVAVGAFADATGDYNTIVGNTAGHEGNQTVAVGFQALANNTADHNIAIGYNAMSSNTVTGADNTAVGYQSMLSVSSGASNVAMGSGALQLNQTGSSNTAVGFGVMSGAINPSQDTAFGYQALQNDQAGSNTAIGYQALQANTTGTFNTAVGTSALIVNTTGIYNTAVGYNALAANTIGQFNTAIGSSALAANTTGTFNTAVGPGALFNNTTGVQNIAIGYGALASNTIGGANIALGYSTLFSNTTGIGNIALGSGALALNTTGSQNVALGGNALANTVGDNNIALGQDVGRFSSASNNILIGNEALLSNTASSSFIVTIGHQSMRNANPVTNGGVAIGYQALQSDLAGANVAIGYQALQTNNTGANNTAVGYQSLNLNAVGTANTAIGYQSLQNDTASNNTAIGASSLNANTTGVSNTAVGSSSLALNTTGINNTAIGAFALDANTVGTDNTAVGLNALGTNTVSNNTAIGSSALAANTTGTFNTAVGKSALAANTVGTNNTALGRNALLVSTTGTDNTALGFNALAANATGTSNNTAVGSSALAANTTGTSNTAVGKSALAGNTVGINNTALGYNSLTTPSIATDNTAVGFNALTATGTGNSNTAVGSSALAANTAGTLNTAVGKSALAANTTGVNNTAVGYNALLATTTTTDNTAVGYNALAANVAATGNTAVGSSALAANTTGTFNTAVGRSALPVNTIGTNNTAVGATTLNVNTTGGFNTAVGSGALNSNTVGTQNSALGAFALNFNTTGSFNTAAGYFALNRNTTGANNTAVGFQAMYFTTVATDNTAVGFSALQNNTTGIQNTAVGSGALQSNTEANNTAVGYNALQSNTTGTFNTAVGISALTSNTGGSNNTAIGYSALASGNAGSNTAVGYNALGATTGGSNTAVGASALGLSTAANNTAVGANALGLSTGGAQNVAVGVAALQNTSVNGNTGVGYLALTANTTGTSNTAVGRTTLSGVTTGSANIAIGNGAGGTLTTGSGNIYINASAASSGEANTIRIGTSQTACFIQGISGATAASGVAVLVGTGGVLGTTTSSRRFKHNIEDMGDQSSDIFKLRPVTFAYNSDEIERKQYGLIAEEVDEVLPEIVVNDEDGLVQTVQYHVLPVLLLNEMQKQQKTIELQQSTIENLTITTENMNAAINSLQVQLQQFMKRIEVLENNK